MNFVNVPCQRLFFFRHLSLLVIILLKCEVCGINMIKSICVNNVQYVIGASMTHSLFCFSCIVCLITPPKHVFIVITYHWYI